MTRHKKYITFSFSFPEDRVAIICRTSKRRRTFEKRNWIKILGEIQLEKARRRNHLPGGEMSPNLTLEVFSDYV
jgi:hypothetical protein